MNLSNYPQPLHDAVTAHPYPLLFAMVSGAHLYGFASPDSDWDLRGVHVLLAREVLGLQPLRESAGALGAVSVDRSALVSTRKGGGVTKEVWQLQDAKAHFSEVVEAAIQEGPQVVTRRGENAVVVLSHREFLRLSQLDTTLDEALAGAPEELEFQRDGLRVPEVTSIGDVHGCLTELQELLTLLGYAVEDDLRVTPPVGRKAVFVGDLLDRGPDTSGVLRLVMGMVAAGTALCVPGNHDEKLKRALEGERFKALHGLRKSLDQLALETPEFWRQVQDFITGETDAFGLSMRFNWVAEYRGAAAVVYDHTPVPQAEWLNNSIDIDTGCVFGGRLTALRPPERELVGLAAHRIYAEPVRPLHPPQASQSAQQAHDELLDLADFTGKRMIEPGFRGRVTVLEDQAAAALETMSRFATDPRWLVYLPPTMSPCETSIREGDLESPQGAFEHYRRAGAETVVCEEKHMGLRAVLTLCRSEAAAQRRFGIAGSIGTVCAGAVHRHSLPAD